MEASKRRVGRPKAELQTGPLVLSERRTRKKIEVELGAEAVEELAEYARWVELSDGMSTAEATAATIEFALRNVFRRDRLWQQHRRGGSRQETGAPSTPPPRSASPPAPPSLPPPSPASTRSSKDQAV